MIFTKGTFDWADGALARRLNKPHSWVMHLMFMEQIFRQ